MTVPPKDKKIAKNAAIVGVVLALMCQLLPPHYQAVCTILAKFCTGGI